jgi:hypothetical protein
MTTSTSTDREAHPMPEATTYVSIHEQRVQMVVATLAAHSELSEEVAHEVAVQVIYDLDHRPEAVRYRG